MGVDDFRARLVRRAAGWRIAVVWLLLSASVASCGGSKDAKTGAGGRARLTVEYSLADARAYARTHPDAAPPGANDWSCRPTASHPRPVVLVHGTLENMAFNWFSLAPLLKNAGYCVFALNYGEEAGRHLALVPGSTHPGGTAPIERSARELRAFVARVLAATGAATVDIVGHSQGGMMPRYYLRFDGGAGKVTNLIGLSPSNHGRRLGPLSRLVDAPRVLGSLLGPALREQAAGSDFLRRLNAGGDTIPGVRYTVIETRYDEVVVPYTSAFLRGPDVTNILLQRACPLDLSDHATTPFDSIALGYVLNALDPAHAVAPHCRVVAAGRGG